MTAKTALEAIGGAVRSCVEEQLRRSSEELGKGAERSCVEELGGGAVRCWVKEH